MTSTAKERALDAFRRRFRRDPEILVRAPGRVNLIGEHVDYNAGLVLPVAIDRAAWIAAAPSRDGLTTLEAVDVVGTVRFTLDQLPAKVDVARAPLPSWARYPAGVAWILGDRELPVVPVDATLASDVPIGAGLSSSAAIEVAFVEDVARARRLAGGRPRARAPLPASGKPLRRCGVRADGSFREPARSARARAAPRLPELRMEARAAAGCDGDRGLRYAGASRARRLGVQRSSPAVRGSGGDSAPYDAERTARCATSHARSSNDAAARCRRSSSVVPSTSSKRSRGWMP